MFKSGLCFLLKRKLADKVAAKGYYVVVPDFLYGDPFNPEDATRPLPVWLKDHPPVSSFTSKIISTCKPITYVLPGNYEAPTQTHRHCNSLSDTIMLC